jgi:hypothetical protein
MPLPVKKRRLYRSDTVFFYGKKHLQIVMRGRMDTAKILVRCGDEFLFASRFDRWPDEAEWGSVDEAVKVRLKAFSPKCDFFLFGFERGVRSYYALLNFAGDVLAFDAEGDCAEGTHFSPGARYLTTCKGLLDLEYFRFRAFDSRRPVASVLWVGDSLYRVMYDDPSRDLRTNAYWYSSAGEELFAYYFNGLDYERRYVPFVSTQYGVHLAFDPQAEELLVFRAADIADPQIYVLRELKKPQKYDRKHVIRVPSIGNYEFYTDKSGKVVGACPPPSA